MGHRDHSLANRLVPLQIAHLHVQLREVLAALADAGRVLGLERLELAAESRGIFDVGVDAFEEIRVDLADHSVGPLGTCDEKGSAETGAGENDETRCDFEDGLDHDLWLLAR